VCAVSPLSAALFATMVGHKRRVRLKVEGLPCAFSVKILRSRQRFKLQWLTIITNIDNSSADFRILCLDCVSNLNNYHMEDDPNGLIRDLVDF